LAGTAPEDYVLPTPNIYGINMVASRIDYQVNPTNQVHFRYSNTPFQEIRALGWGNNVAEPSGNAPLTRNGVNWSFNWTASLRPRTVFSLRFGAAAQDSNRAIRSRRRKRHGHSHCRR
jgi:hypothetical protein